MGIAAEDWNQPTPDGIAMILGSGLQFPVFRAKRVVLAMSMAAEDWKL